MKRPCFQIFFLAFFPILITSCIFGPETNPSYLGNINTPWPVVKHEVNRTYIFNLTDKLYSWDPANPNAFTARNLSPQDIADVQKVLQSALQGLVAKYKKVSIDANAYLKTTVKDKLVLEIRLTTNDIPARIIPNANNGGTIEISLNCIRAITENCITTVFTANTNDFNVENASTNLSSPLARYFQYRQSVTQLEANGYSLENYFALLDDVRSAQSLDRQYFGTLLFIIGHEMGHQALGTVWPPPTLLLKQKAELDADRFSCLLLSDIYVGLSITRIPISVSANNPANPAATQFAGYLYDVDTNRLEKCLGYGLFFGTRFEYTYADSTNFPVSWYPPNDVRQIECHKAYVFALSRHENDTLNLVERHDTINILVGGVLSGVSPLFENVLQQE
jgi:hypothetical protein